MGIYAEALKERKERGSVNDGIQAPKEGGIYAQALKKRRQEQMTHDVRPEPPEETAAERDLPELGSSGLLAGEDMAPGAVLAPILLSTTNPGEISQIIRQHYPHIKQQQDEAGNEILYNPKNQVQTIVNAPGISKMDVLQGLGLMAAFTPAGGAAMGAGTTTGKVAAGSLAAGATETGLQALQKGAGGEFDVSEIGLSAALGGASELGAAKLGQMQAARQAKRLRTEKEAIGEVSGEIAGAARTEQATGVRFFPGQKTKDPFALEEQAFVASLPAAARKARLKILTQNREVGRAVDRFLQDIAPERAVETAALNVRDIAEEAITNATVARSAGVGPKFKKVWNQDIVIDVKDTIKGIDDLIKEYPPGKIRNLLTQVKASVSGAKKPVDGSNLKRLHNLKREIWAKIEGFERDAPLNKEIKRNLTELYADIVGKLKKEAPGYDEALKDYIARTPDVEALTKGKIGQISKIKDADLKSVTGKIFDQAETNPSVIRLTRKVINGQDPAAWNAIVRTEAQKRLKNIDLDIENLTPDNAPAKIHRALFGSGAKRKILLESLSREQKANAIFIEDALKRAALGRPGGSQTGVRQVISDKIKGAGLALRRFLTNPVQRAIATGEESAFNRSASRMADVIFDTEWTPRLTRIRKLSNPEIELIKLLKTTPQTTRVENER